MKRHLVPFSIAVILMFVTCGRDPGSFRNKVVSEALTVINKNFDRYISAYTSGIVPSNGTIKVVFTKEFASLIDKSRTSNLFSFSPSMKGVAEWADDLTLVFKPSSLLKPGEQYKGTLNLSKLGSTENDCRTFPINVRTVAKDFSVDVNPIACELPLGESYTVSGVVSTSDYVEPAEVEKYLSVKLGHKSKDIRWEHNNGNTHSFFVENVERTNRNNKLDFAWNGAHFGARAKGKIAVDIPAKDVFKATSVKVKTGETKSIEVVFSDQLDASADLDGLVTMQPSHDLTCEVEGNKLVIVPADKLTGNVTLSIDAALRNNNGERLGETYTQDVTLTPIPPVIRTVGKGVIMPSSGELLFPFEAASLSAVDITIIKIFENNLPYFLQNNEMGSVDPYPALKNFGRPIYRGKINLTADPALDPNQYNRFTINLANYITVEPGVLYRIELSMRPSYSLYPCTEKSGSSDYEEMLDLMNSDKEYEKSDDYYDYSDENYYYEYAYHYDERDNPCSDAYFSPWKKVVRNILASDFGLMAKCDVDNNTTVFVNDIRNTQPVEGAKVDIYDLQNQILGSSVTNKDGVAVVSCARKPFLVIAHKDKNRNYLSIADGNAMSMSSFDVAGETPQNGIRAFLYTERDVRRPGDTIYLGVIARDMITGLPAGHPVHYELYNPAGQRIDDQIATLNDKGFLTFTSVTRDDAVTGNYKALVRIGAASFAKTLRVETVKPNRLKILLNFPTEILGGENKAIAANLKAAWLNGSAAHDLHSTVKLLLKPVKTTFDHYSQYTFDDPAAEFSFESTQIFDSTINSAGEAALSFTPDAQLQAPGMLNAIFTAQVFEKGGDASITQVVKPYAPYPVFVGINMPGLGNTGRMLFTDKDNQIRIVTVDANGKPVNSSVSVVVYKINYRWWWESDDDEHLGSYISNSGYSPVFEKTVETINGEGSATFKVGKYDWGRYLVRASIASGHSTGKVILIDWPWDYGMKPGGNDGATLLQVNTDREKYNVGDDISLTFPSPANGRAIITMENGAKVIDVIKSVLTNGGNTTIKIKATPEMAPNAFVYVTLLQPHSQTVNDAPIRLYGVVPVMVEDPSTHITPVITMADQIRSQQPFEVKVSEKNNREMTYTLAIVDEGLLDLTAFKTPDPWKWFFVKQALGVRTWDLYDMVMGAFGGKLGRMFSVGGDMAVIDQSKNKAKRFVPVVKFLGPFTITAGGTGTHMITLPQYTGSVRVMVVGAGTGNTFGSAEKSVIVSDPLMVLATAPRVLSPNDRTALPVTVFTQNKDLTDVTVTITGNEMVSFMHNKTTVHFNEPGDKDVSFALATAAKTGKAIIRVDAESGGEKASYSLEVEVRSPNPMESRSEMKLLQPGDKIDKSFTPFGMEGSSTISAEICALPSINLSGRLSFLTSYPHGCSEQITSGAFPQIYLPDVLGSSLADPDKIKYNVNSAIRTLATRQLSSGAITLWPGGTYADDWVTSYAGHFLIEAQKMGYTIPSGMLNKWESYQRAEASSWRYKGQYRYTCNDQAYRLFTLALNGTPEKGAMNRMKEITDLPQLAKWLLAAAYATTGRTEASQSLIDVRNLKTDTEFYSYYYGSDLRDKEIILYTLTNLGNTNEAMAVLKEVAQRLSSNDWYSTQTTAWGLYAYMNFSHRVSNGTQGGDVKASVNLNGNKEMLNAQGGTILKEYKTASGKNNIVVRNESKIPLFVTITEKGVSLAPDALVIEQNMKMTCDYCQLDGKAIDISSLAQGTQFMMLISVTNTTFRQIDNIALTQMVPSGWEILNTRLFETVTPIKESDYDSRDFRDDRVYTYFSLKSGETKRFYLLLTAAYRGTYTVPAVICEAMYDNGVKARRPGMQVNVTEPK
jgi:alpha-2-macroglobulin